MRRAGKTQEMEPEAIVILSGRVNVYAVYGGGFSGVFAFPGIRARWVGCYVINVLTDQTLKLKNIYISTHFIQKLKNVFLFNSLLFMLVLC